MTMGIHPENFVWKLEQGESFAAPEVVMTYSSEGLSGMTHIYMVVPRAVIRGEYRVKSVRFLTITGKLRTLILTPINY